MSSGTTHYTRYFHATLIACSVVLAFAIAIAARAPETEAKRGKTSASKPKLPKITKVSPLTAVTIGTTLKLNGANFVTGKKKLIVIFKRNGSKRTFTARGTATSTTRASVIVPDLRADLVTLNPKPQDNIYKLRPITRNGAVKSWTANALSPRIDPFAIPQGEVSTGPSGDCDADGQKNGVDSDDDNDLLLDTIELTIGTNVCAKDTDGDVVSDFYEYTVAYALNGGPVLPYPSLAPYPNPLVNDDGDYDDDRMTTLQEYQAWQYTGQMSRFYSDANRDSDGDGKIDPAEDEDRDLLPNHIEFFGMKDLNWLRTDTDGDGLCDGLDDQDHDGPPTSLAVADCNAPVPNNGPLPAFPPTDPANTVPGGDPDPARIDGDDNLYSNFYEWYNEGADPDVVVAMYKACLPSGYPVSPYCHDPNDWNPFPIP